MALHRILILDTDENYYNKCSKILSQYQENDMEIFEATLVKNWKQFLTEYNEEQPVIVILDAEIN